MKSGKLTRDPCFPQAKVQFIGFPSVLGSSRASVSVGQAVWTPGRSLLPPRPQPCCTDQALQNSSHCSKALVIRRRPAPRNAVCGEVKTHTVKRNWKVSLTLLHASGSPRRLGLGNVKPTLGGWLWAPTCSAKSLHWLWVTPMVTSKPCPGPGGLWSTPLLSHLPRVPPTTLLPHSGCTGLFWLLPVLKIQFLPSEGLFPLPYFYLVSNVSSCRFSFSAMLPEKHHHLSPSTKDMKVPWEHLYFLMMVLSQLHLSHCIFSAPTIVSIITLATIAVKQLYI